MPLAAAHPANDDAPDIAVTAGLDVLREKLRIQAGGAPPGRGAGDRELTLWLAARSVVQLEEFDRAEASRRFGVERS